MSFWSGIFGQSSFSQRHPFELIFGELSKNIWLQMGKLPKSSFDFFGCRSHPIFDRDFEISKPWSKMGWHQHPKKSKLDLGILILQLLQNGFRWKEQFWYRSSATEAFLCFLRSLKWLRNAFRPSGDQIWSWKNQFSSNPIPARPSLLLAFYHRWIIVFGDKSTQGSKNSA